MPGSGNRVIPFAWLPWGDSDAMAECSGMVGKVNASWKEELQKVDKRASKTLPNEKGDAITACSF